METEGLGPTRFRWALLLHKNPFQTFPPLPPLHTHPSDSFSGLTASRITVSALCFLGLRVPEPNYLISSFNLLARLGSTEAHTTACDWLSGHKKLPFFN